MTGPGRVSPFTQAVTLHREGRIAEARAAYTHFIESDPNDFQALYMLGVLEVQTRNLARAVDMLTRAAALAPMNAAIHSNAGIALNEAGYPAEALQFFDHAVSLEPDNADIHYNRAKVLRAMGRVAETAASYERVVAAQPDNADARWALSVCYLQLGDLARGWPLYEARWQAPSLKLGRNFSQPLWQGIQPLSGKSILLHNEQGFGDALQFCRYVPRVAAQGARVILEVQKPLIGLLKQLDGVAEIVASGEPLSETDYHCPLLSLPFAFRTTLETIPASANYLVADPQRVEAWRRKLGPQTAPRIGIAWSGNAHQVNDANRSIAFETFAAQLPSGFEYISLQKDVRVADAAALRARDDIRTFAEELTDFAETAALTTLMDGVVTVCTSTAHLAGALGKPTVVLLCFDPCWRWLLERSDSPWYPSVTVIRQTRPGDWQGVLEQAFAPVQLQKIFRL